MFNPPRSFHDGAFTPRQFPLDPFHHVHPWSVDLDVLPGDHSLALQQKVILVLGEPPLSALTPLLQSPHLSSSLLIIATARTCPFPSTFIPSLTILRLASPITSSDQAAHRLVHIFQWADRLAASWRTHPSPPQFQEFNEDRSLSPSKEHQRQQPPPSRPISWFHGPNNVISSTSSSPASSQIGLQTPPRSTSRLSILSANRNSRNSSFLGGAGGSSSSTSLSGLSTITMTGVPTPTPTSSPDTPSFDALLNFLPPDGPTDRSLLKLAILVTTMSRPFLTASADAGVISRGPGGMSRQSESKKKSSLRLGFRTSTRANVRTRAASAGSGPYALSTSVAAAASVSPSPNTQLIHLIPPPRSSLFRPLESFCLSFAYPQTYSHHHPSYYAKNNHLTGLAGLTTPPPRPYLLPPYALSEVLPLPFSPTGKPQWSLFEVILSGVLDASWASGNGSGDGGSEDESENGFGPGEFGMRAMMMHGGNSNMDGVGRRAWLSGVREIVVRGGGGGGGVAFPKATATGVTMTRRAFEKSPMRGGGGPAGVGSGWSPSALVGGTMGYPTPPSSEGSSPSVSPAPEVEDRDREYGGVRRTKVPLTPSTSSESTPGLLDGIRANVGRSNSNSVSGSCASTRSGSRTHVVSEEPRAPSTIGKKKKGLLRWMRSSSASSTSPVAVGGGMKR